ncbi:MAG: GNAT family N-acetyltransferase [Alphaproteobacteria bacterium]
MKKPAPEATAGWEVVPATEADWPGIWEIFRDVVQAQDTYSYAPDTTEEQAKDMWMGAGKYGTGASAFVVRDGGKVVGTFSLRANHYGQGSHVANAAYMTRKDQRGRGIARAMCLFSMAEAKRRGFLSMQFNYVVSTNTGAVRLWESLGFKTIGVSPKSYRHGKLGYVDIYIMHRFLEEMQS